QAVHLSHVGEEHQEMVGGGHQKLLDVIILNSLHALDTFAAQVLAAEIVDGHPLDITQVGHGDHGIYVGDHVLHGNIKFIEPDGGSSGIAVFFGNLQTCLTDYAKQHIPVCQNCLQLADPLHQFLIFALQLLPFQTCQC